MKIKRRARREAKRLFRLCLVNNLVDEERVRRVLQSVISAGHRDCPAILSQFRRLVKLELARHTAQIESAAPLPPDVLASVQAGLAQRYGPGLITAVTERPALIGGMRIQVGCDVYDGSVRAGLAALEKSF